MRYLFDFTQTLTTDHLASTLRITSDGDGSPTCLDKEDCTCEPAPGATIRYCHWFSLFYQCISFSRADIARGIWELVKKRRGSHGLELLRTRMLSEIGRGGMDPYLHLVVDKWTVDIQDGLSTVHERELLDFFVDTASLPVDQLDSVGQSALIHAAYNNNVESLDALLAKGADIDFQDLLDSMTALDAACTCNAERAAFYLLGMGEFEVERSCVARRRPYSRTDLLDIDQWTSLHTSASHGSIELLKAILHTPMGDGRTTSGFHLLDALTANSNETALMLSIDNNTMDVIAMLLEEGAALDVISKVGETALHSAVRLGNWNLCQLLLDMGADGGTEIDNGAGNSALFHPIMSLWKGGDADLKASDRQAIML